MVTARVSGLIVTVAELVAVAPDASVAMTDIESVPFVLYIVVKLAPVPDDGVPPVQAEVFKDDADPGQVPGGHLHDDAPGGGQHPEADDRGGRVVRIAGR